MEYVTNEVIIKSNILHKRIYNAKIMMWKRGIEPENLYLGKKEMKILKDYLLEMSEKFFSLNSNFKCMDLLVFEVKAEKHFKVC